jgi:RNA polymerase sigma-70 factor (sigma-E family)
MIGEPRTLELDAAFDAFVAEGSARLLRSAVLLCGDRGVAEDLLQATLVRVAEHWRAAREAPAAYAHRVLVNLLHDRRRGLGRRPVEQPLTDTHVASGPLGRDHAEFLGERDALIRALRTLPSRQREVLVLRFYADLSVEETAAAIGVSAGAVKTHTSRALAHLRGALTEPAAVAAEEEVHRADR